MSVGDLAISRRFYVDGFGWTPIFENAEILFHQMNGLVLGAWLDGWQILRNGDAPAHGGFRGYVADPDDHAWETAWNPAWTIDECGHVTFGL